MNAEVFAEWLRRQGHKVVQTPSSYWYEAGPHVYQAFPYHWVIQPSAEELDELLRRRRAVAVRYSAPLAEPHGKVSYHIVCEGPYTLETLPRQARQSVTKGLQYADVKQIPIARLAAEGWPLRRDTLARQGREGAETEDGWQRLCRSAADLPGFEAWGAIHEGQLVASFLALVCGDCYLLPYEQSASAHLEHRVNNAIFYCVTNAALSRPGITKVFFCLESLDAPCSVDEFKFRMGLAALPVRQRVAFHPALAPAHTCAPGYTLVHRLRHRYPHQAQLAKLDGLLHFYLEGERPAAQQEWPTHVAQFRPLAPTL